MFKCRGSALGEHMSGKEQSEERNGWTNRHFTRPSGESIHGHNFCLLCAPRRFAEIFEELRAVGLNAGSDLIENLYREPPGLAGVLSISGGTAPIITAMATRSVPWRPI